MNSENWLLGLGAFIFILAFGAGSYWYGGEIEYKKGYSEGLSHGAGTVCIGGIINSSKSFFVTTLCPSALTRVTLNNSVCMVNGTNYTDYDVKSCVRCEIPK